MILGNLNLDFITQSDLDNSVYNERTECHHANGLWEEINIDPPTYPENSAIVYQAFGDEAPDWAHKVKEMFDWVEMKQITIIKILPGCFIPPHKDKMYMLKKSITEAGFNVEDYDLIRINIFLTDHKIGHVFNLNNKFLDKYKKGDYLYILPNEIHGVANIGAEPRYTMQVTGVVDKRKNT